MLAISLLGFIAAKASDGGPGPGDGKKDELNGKPREVFIPAEIALQHRNNDLEIIKSKQSITFEEQNPELDGMHYYLTHKFPLFDSNNEVYAVGGISTDITESKNAEETLMESENKFRAIYENNSAAIAIIEPDTTISMVNDAYCQISGYSKQEVVGTSWTKQIHQPTSNA